MNKNTYQCRTTRKIYLLSIISLLGCSGGNGGSSSVSSSNPGNVDSSQLQIIAPKTIYSKSGESGTGYVVINNPGATVIGNLHYSLSNLVGGAIGASVDLASAANCTKIPANSQCNVKVIIPSGAVAGSFGFVVDNSSDLLDKVSKSAKATTTSIQTVGVEQAAYNSLSGADGITLSYYHTVVNGAPYILVNGLVASTNAGSFNNIVLVDGNGNPIPNQSLINSTVSNSQGSTFSVLLPVSSGIGISQTIKVQTQQVSNGQTQVISTANSSSTLTTTTGVGIANTLPNAVYLTAANPEQIITFSNTGDVVAQLQSLAASNPNIEIVFNPTLLASGATTMATLRLKSSSVSATSGSTTLTYNNGQGEVTSSVQVGQNVNPVPTLSPTPIPVLGPTPTPSPTPVAVAGLTAIFSPSNDFFTTTAVGEVSRQLSITNTGDTLEKNIVLTLPAGFTIDTGSSNSCTVTQTTNPAIISDELVAGTGGCDVTVKYSNNAATAEAGANISIAYDYNNGTAAPTAVTAAVNYRVTQSTANLTLSSPANPFIFPTTLMDGTATTDTQIFTIQNSGDGEASGIDATVNSTTLSGLFSATVTGVTNGCGATLVAGATCEYGVQFGVVPDNTSAGAKAGNLTVSYKTYPAAATVTDLVANFSGQVATSGSAVFNTPASGTPGGGFTGTWPTLSIAQNTAGVNATITYTITNTGNDAATDFVVILPSAPSGWNTPTTNCPTSTGTNLAINASCSVTITPETSAATTITASNMSIGMAWSDQNSPTGETQNMQLPLPDVTVVGLPPPQINAVTPANNATEVATNASIVITFSEPMDTSTIIPDDTIYIDYQWGGYYSYGTPVFSNNNQTVTISLGAGETLGIKQSHTIFLDQTRIKSQTGVAMGSNTESAVSSFTTLDGGVIFVSSSSHNGNYGGLAALNNVCKTEGASKIPTAVWQAMLSSTNVTSVANYYLFDAANSGNYYRGILIGTGANLAPSSYTAPQTLANVIPGSGTYWYSIGYPNKGPWSTSIGSCENSAFTAQWSGTTQQSFYGKLNTTLPYALGSGDGFFCNTLRYLICIQI